MELSPNSADVLLEVAHIYRQRGQPERCLTAIYSLLDAYPSGEEPQQVLVLQGLTLIDLGRPQQAAEALTAATRKGPPNADLYFYLAQAYSAAGRAAEAGTAAQQALAVNGSHEPTRQLLAQLAALPAPGAAQAR
jgi:predicted Zn-dependent protease